ncbi:MAG: O-antigen ligase family protein [Muribaculaceae bacterium]|nr:O-antigen ligase family protein [Muribaculaceae bacterium]
MDRALIFVTLALALFFFIAREGSRMNKERWHEIIIAVYVFSCSFARLFLPIYKAGGDPSGSFGDSLSIWSFHAFALLLIWLIARVKQWHIRRPKLLLALVFLVYAGCTFLNPYNISRLQTAMAVFYLLSFAVFMYLFTNSFTVKTVVNGIFMGLMITVVLHLVLCILYPVMNMEMAVKLFDHEASTRSDERIGAVGTMGHPNVLGTYASYYFMFFAGCFATAYKRRQSAILAGMSFLVIVLTASRSALLASVAAVLALVVFYIFRRYKLLSFQSILKGIIPVGALIALLLTGPLSFLFSDVEDLDEMTTARLLHYYCGYEIFEDHPLVGVGLNAHLAYLVENGSAVMFEQVFDMTDIWQPEEFMFTNPIHNIWIILIDELGLIGFLPILAFVFWYIATFKRRTRQSRNRYYNILNISGLGVICCWLVQGNSDWAPLTPQVLSLSLMFVALSLNRHYAAEEHPEFETVEEAKRRTRAQEAQEKDADDETLSVQPA